MKSDELISYFNEHVCYEFRMLRGTYERFPYCADTITRNALLESYGMHARNLSDFLLNSGKSNTVGAKKYNPEFRTRKPSEITGAFQRLNSGLHHLGTARAKGDKEKFNLDDATAILAWIKGDMYRFLDELPEPYKSGVDWKTPAPPSDAYFVGASSVPTATNTVGASTANFTRSQDS